MKKRVIWIILIGVLIVLFSAIVYHAFKFATDKNEVSKEPINNTEIFNDSCKIDDDCVPASCCHPTSCVNKNSAPDCFNTFCTMECQGGTLDCGYGSCKCINKRCSAVLSQ